MNEKGRSGEYKRGRERRGEEGREVIQAHFNVG